jgi:hypothetical protein
MNMIHPVDHTSLIYNQSQPINNSHIDPTLHDHLYSHQSQEVADAILHNTDYNAESQLPVEMDEATASAIKASIDNSHAQQHAHYHEQDRLDAGFDDYNFLPGEEENPTISPAPQHAPFDKPNRIEGTTPCPEHFHFSSRAEFDLWFAGETSWCHFVQRRSTTPDTRAEERMKMRIRAYERALAGELKTHRCNHMDLADAYSYAARGSSGGATTQDPTSE